MAKLYSVSEFKERIDRRIDAFFTRKIREANTIDTDYETLIKAMQQFIARGGKRMRPYLAYISYVGHGGKEVDKFLNAAVGLELLHNFMLIHDDIIDNDTERYNGANIAGAYERALRGLVGAHAARVGQNIALLAGDLNLSFANEAVLASSFTEKTKINLLWHLNQATFTAAGGELLDIMAPYRELEEAGILHMYEYKSGIYSIEIPLRFGAAAAGVKNPDFSIFSRPAGVCFQLRDDLAGMYSSSEKIGKPITTDLAEAKRTLLVAHALKNGSTTQVAALHQLLGKDETSEADVLAARTILEKTNSKAYVENLCGFLAAKAVAAIAKLRINKETRKVLETTMRQLLDLKSR